MGIYTVHMNGNIEEPSVAERAVFVREGFGWSAFLLGPLWLIWNRAWLILTSWIAVQVAIGVSVHLGFFHPLAQTGVELILAMALGFEAAPLRRYVLRRRGFTLVDVVNERRLQSAEHRFYARWTHPVKDTPIHSVQSIRPGMVGLFPSAGA